MRETLFILLAVLILGACAEDSSDYPPPSLGPDEVVAAASIFLAEQEIDVAKYHLGDLGFNYVTRKWTLHFESKSGVIHDYYFVKIEDGNISEISLSGR